jgi:putative toxin-antitoxin system antitoxin component (TIGR02293 family)
VSVYPAIESVVETLGGARLLRAQVRTLVDLARLVSNGLPFRSLRAVAERYPEPYRRRIELLVVSRTTLQRREASGVLSPEESERLERVARLSALAEYVWESRDAAQQWLTTPLPLLDGEAPLDLAATDLGARRVEDVLWKLEHSLPV